MSDIKNYKIKRAGLGLFIASALLLAGYYTYSCLHVDRSKALASRVKVEAYIHYSFISEGKVLFDFDQDTIEGLGFFTKRWTLLPSCQGRMLIQMNPIAWKNKYAHIQPDTLLKEQAQLLDRCYQVAKWNAGELEYYHRSHNVTDEGYNRISQFTVREVKLRDSVKKMMDSIKHFPKGRSLQVKRVVKLVAISDGKRLSMKKNKDGYYQLVSAKTPKDASALPSYYAKELIDMSVSQTVKLPQLFFDLDSTTQYYGEVDSLCRPHGEGYSFDNKGAYYAGSWKHGKRDGFGFAVAPKKTMKVGEWKMGVFKGERMVYSSDRIYGIDVSKYQHVIGKKKYKIDWKRLRITHLGNISKKRISGNVSYPISFVYVKSTEGSSLLNPYYRTDYLSARACGFKVGSYHFFSTRSAAALQARQFLKHTIVRKGDFPPVLDVEPTREQIQKMGGINILFARVRTWLRFVERETGVKPILYISQSFVNRYLNFAPDLKHNYLIWIARYGEYKPDIRLIYWQLCPDGSVSGIHGHVDINVFNGYKEAYSQFVREKTVGAK